MRFPMTPMRHHQTAFTGDATNLACSSTHGPAGYPPAPLLSTPPPSQSLKPLQSMDADRELIPGIETEPSSGNPYRTPPQNKKLFASFVRHAFSSSSPIQVEADPMASDGDDDGGPSEAAPRFRVVAEVATSEQNLASTEFITPRANRASYLQETAPKFESSLPAAYTSPSEIGAPANEPVHAWLEEAREPSEADPPPTSEPQPSQVLRSRSNQQDTDHFRAKRQRRKRELDSESFAGPESSDDEDDDQVECAEYERDGGGPFFETFQEQVTLVDSLGEALDLSPELVGPGFEYDSAVGCHVAYKKNYLSLSASLRLPDDDAFLETPVLPSSRPVPSFTFELSAITCTEPALPVPLLQFNASRARSTATNVKPQYVDINQTQHAKRGQRVTIKYNRIQFKHSTGNNPRSTAGAIAHNLRKNVKITEPNQAARVRLVVTVSAGFSDENDRCGGAEKQGSVDTSGENESKVCPQKLVRIGQCKLDFIVFETTPVDKVSFTKISLDSR
ncbi:hypothetical protein OIV83_005651 [Microbotryomycetes sp. JL201]|nr:hypothetical protein OIV83_005651 [Microbotryomycetes sp. JL201]